MSSDLERRRVLFTTGIRSEYDLIYPVLLAAGRRPELEVGLVVTGAHLSPLYGHTVEQVERDGFPIVGRVESLLGSDSPAGRAKSAAIEMMGLVDVFSSFRPALALAMGDREEALAVAAVGCYMGVPVAHMGGGDTSDNGHVDNSVRYAVTKLAHLHLTTTQSSAERVIRFGEEPWRVHVVGASGLDRLRSVEQLTRAELAGRLGVELGDGPYVVVVQHAMTERVERAGEEMRVTLEAVAALGVNAFVGYPNSDAGSQAIIREVEAFAERVPRIHAYRNLSREVFVNLLRHAGVVVGNSSMGVIETPLLGLPSVMVGERQVGREHGDNAVFVPYDAAAIGEAVRRALYDPNVRERARSGHNPYGDGHTGERVAALLAETALDLKLLSKRNTF